MARLVHLGLRNYVPADRIAECHRADQAWVQRLVRAAKRGSPGVPILDLTNGRRTRSVVFLATGHLVLSALSPETIRNRLRAAQR
ncbi:MAG TPA: DUF370 domain-containing protein [Dehalococcoidia bacterium]|nr:DUF370 domain-containing protein [Dehalococcoidia bacterium]